MPSTSPTRRRWFQFSLASLVVLPSVLAVLWVESARWPAKFDAIEINQRVTLDGLIEERRPVKLDRAPHLEEIVWRGSVGSLAVIIAWLAIRWSLARLGK